MDPRSWFAALSLGNVEEVKRLIAAGTDVNMRNNEGQTALHLAAQQGNYYDTAAPLVLALLAAGGDKDARQSGGWTPLHMAIANAKPAVVSALLAFKAQTELQDNEGKAPLHMAAKEGHPEIVKELLAAGADKNVRTAGVGATPLHFAAVYYHPATAEILLAAGADTQAKNKYGQTALDMAKEELAKFVSQRSSGGYNSLYGNAEKEKKCAAVVELLAAVSEKNSVSFLKRLFSAKESASSDISPRGSPQPSGASEPEPASILEAAREGDLQKVKGLLKGDSDLVSARENKGNTPLHLAAVNRHQDVAKLLLVNRAEVDARNNNDATPLCLAALNGAKGIVELLLANKAEVDARDNTGATPLHCAVTNGHKEIGEVLLARGAAVNGKNNKGEAPLHWAAEKGHKEIAGLLLANKADLDARDANNMTPLHWAAWKGYNQVAEILLANRAEVSSKSSSDATPLHYAALAGQKGMAELLLSHGAAVNARTTKSETPLDWAVRKGHTQITELLRQHGGDGIEQQASVRFTTFAEKATQGPADCEIAIGEWDSLYEALSSKLIGSGVTARQVVDLVNERLIGVCPMCRVLSPGKGLQLTNLMRQTSVFVGAPADAYRFLKGHCRTESCPSKKILIFWMPDEDRDAIARLGDMGIVVRPRLASIAPPAPAQVAAIISSVKAANLDCWKSSGEPEAWVGEHVRGWNHNDWLALLTSLHNSQFWPMDEAAIGQHIEMMRAKLNRAEASVTPKPISFADQLRGVLLQDFRDRPETRTFRDLPRIYAELRPIFDSSKNSATDIRRCIRLCREQLVETPDLDIVYSWLSTLYERDDQSAEALTALNEGLVKCKRVSALLANLGVYLLHHKSADLCLQSLSKAILAQEPPRKDANPYLYLSYICRVFQMEDEADSMLRIVDSLPNSARLDGSLQQEILSVFLTEVGRLQPILLSQIFSLLSNGRIDG